MKQRRKELVLLLVLAQVELVVLVHRHLEGQELVLDQEAVVEEEVAEAVSHQTPSFREATLFALWVQ